MTKPIGGLRVLNDHIAKDAHGALAARPRTLTNDFFSRRTGEIDLTFMGIFQRRIVHAGISSIPLYSIRTLCSVEI
jgi:catalase (peroxidase I)